MATYSNKEEVNEHINSLVTCLKRGEIRGSYDIAMKTVLVLRKAVGQLRWSTAKELMDFVREAGKSLIDAQPSEDAVGNMVRRILKIIREEYATAVGKGEGTVKPNSFCWISSINQATSQVMQPDAICFRKYVKGRWKILYILLWQVKDLPIS